MQVVLAKSTAGGGSGTTVSVSLSTPAANQVVLFVLTYYASASPNNTVVAPTITTAGGLSWSTGGTAEYIGYSGGNTYLYQTSFYASAATAITTPVTVVATFATAVNYVYNLESYASTVAPTVLPIFTPYSFDSRDGSIYSTEVSAISGVGDGINPTTTLYDQAVVYSGSQIERICINAGGAQTYQLYSLSSSSGTSTYQVPIGGNANVFFQTIGQIGNTLYWGGGAVCSVYKALNPTGYNVSDLTVTNLNDSGTGSLRAAMTAAQGIPGSTVNATGVTGTIYLQSALPNITASINIVGPPSGTLAVNCGYAYQLFNITASSGSVNIQKFTFENFNATADVVAIASGSVNLTLTNCIFQNQTANGSYDIIDASATTGTISCSSCLFQNLNSTVLYIGASGNLTVVASTIANISNGHGIYTGNGATVTIINSTFLNISSSFYPVNLGYSGNLSMTFCTIDTANRIFAASGTGTITLLNCLAYNLSATAYSYAEAPTITITYCDCNFSITGTGNLQLNPIFQVFNGMEVPLSTASPVLGAGQNLGWLTVDQRGQTRPNPPAMGAWDSPFVSLPNYTSLWLQALNEPGTGVQLTWGGAWGTGWDIWRGTSSGGETLLVSNLTYETLTNNGIQALVYTDTTVSTGTTYYYKVTPTGATTFSNEASVTVTTTYTLSVDGGCGQPYGSKAYVDNCAEPVLTMNTPQICQEGQFPQAVASSAVIARIGGSGLFGPGQ